MERHYDFSKAEKNPYAKRLGEPAVNWRERITLDAGRERGQPCMRGTRIPVSVILDNLAAGENDATILSEYPSLTREHIRAALAFAAYLARGHVALNQIIRDE